MNTVKSNDGTAIAYDRVGSGPPLIFVGGAFSWRRWKGFLRLAELLSERFTVINYDRRGRGGSGDPPPYAIEREFEDLEAMISLAGGSSFVWGLSSGGTLALEAPVPGSRSKLAAYEPPFIVDRAHGVPPADFVEHLRKLVDEDRRSEAARYFMASVMGMPAAIPALMTLWPPLWSKLKATAPTLLYDALLIEPHARGRAPEAAEWAAVSTPALIVSGEKSPEKLRLGAAALAAALPNAVHRPLEGVSHNVKMPALAPALAEFFGGREAGTRSAPVP